MVERTDYGYDCWPEHIVMARTEWDGRLVGFNAVERSLSDCMILSDLLPSTPWTGQRPNMEDAVFDLEANVASHPFFVIHVPGESPNAPTPKPDDEEMARNSFKTSLEDTQFFKQFAAAQSKKKTDQSEQAFKTDLINIERVARVVATSSSLQSLHILGEWTWTLEEGTRAIASALKSNSSLKVLGIFGRRLDSFGHLSHGIEGLGDALRDNKALRLMILRGCRVGSVSAISMSGGLSVNSTLKALDISFNKIGDKGASSIFSALEGNRALERIRLVDCGISSNGFKEIARSLTENDGLRMIDLSGNDAVCTEGCVEIFRALNARVANLEELILDGPGDKMEQPDSKIQTRNKAEHDLLNVPAGVYYAGIRDALSRNTSLKVLSLGHLASADEGATAIGEALKVNSTLKELRMSDSAFTSVGLRPLAAALRSESTALRVMNIAMTRGRHSKVKPENKGKLDAGTTAIGEALCVNSTLEELRITCSEITSDGVWQLAIVLGSERTSMRVLDLSGNDADDEAVQAIAHAIRFNDTLTELNLKGYRKSADESEHRSKVVALGLAIRDYRRDATFTLKGVGLGHFWRELGLGLEFESTVENHRVQDTSNVRIIAEFEVQRKKLLAFAMGTHTRLGGGDEGGGWRSMVFLAVDSLVMRIVGVELWREVPA